MSQTLRESLFKEWDSCTVTQTPAEIALVKTLIEDICELREAISNHVEVESGFYSNECIGLGGADDIIEALSKSTFRFRQLGIEVGE